MTQEEKTTLTRFLDLAGDYLRDGYALKREYADSPEPVDSAEPPPGDFSSLPLAYLVDEAASETGGEALEGLSAAIANCRDCGLAETRTLSVPGEGVSFPLVMVIGEAPGTDEDAAGRPFVGRAGQLLDKMLASIGLSRDKNCYIANTVKCRPPGNRDPEASEAAACWPYLEQQIAMLQPKLILCAGRVAAQNLLKTDRGINALRGEFFEFKIQDSVIPLLCTYHPSAVLRDESLKRPAWEDLKLLKSKLEIYENNKAFNH